MKNKKTSHEINSNEILKYQNIFSIFVSPHVRCCKVCAKIEGESCGGPGNFSGICEPGLSCISKPPLIGAVGICLGKIKVAGVWANSK